MPTHFFLQEHDPLLLVMISEINFAINILVVIDFGQRSFPYFCTQANRPAGQKKEPDQPDDKEFRTRAAKRALQGGRRLR